MAESDDTMARLSRLEGAFIQVTDILVQQGERSDSLGVRFDALTQRFDALNQRVDALQGEVRTMRETLTERLDRLIAVTTPNGRWASLG
jgi:hypothetical protein